MYKRKCSKTNRSVKNESIRNELELKQVLCKENLEVHVTKRNIHKIFTN